MPSKGLNEAAAPGDAAPVNRSQTPAGKLEDPRHRFGRFGEDVAARFVCAKGYEILERNVRTPYGEIDLICLDSDVVVFIEVKARRGSSGLEAVDGRKRRRLSRLALAFLARVGWLERRARFDVIAVGSDGACTHVVNAFDCAPGTSSLR